MKSELTIEESARLVELGVDPNLATKRNLGLSVPTGEPHIYEIIKKGGEPIFRITDLFSILPKELIYPSPRILTITAAGDLYFVFYATWEKEYEHSTEDTVTHHDGDKMFSSHELIDALYMLLVYYLEKNDFKVEPKTPQP